jgi:hypothetical protein
MIGTNKLDQRRRFFLNSFKQHGYFSRRFDVVFPAVNGTVWSEDIGARSETIFDGAARDFLRHFRVRKNRVYDADLNQIVGGTFCHFLDSESLKTRLPTDFFWPWYFPR